MYVSSCEPKGEGSRSGLGRGAADAYACSLHLWLTMMVLTANLSSRQDFPTPESPMRRSCRQGKRLGDKQGGRGRQQKKYRPHLEQVIAVDSAKQAETGGQPVHRCLIKAQAVGVLTTLDSCCLVHAAWEFGWVRKYAYEGRQKRAAQHCCLETKHSQKGMINATLGQTEACNTAGQRFCFWSPGCLWGRKKKMRLM